MKILIALLIAGSVFSCKNTNKKSEPKIETDVEVEAKELPIKKDEVKESKIIGKFHTDFMGGLVLDRELKVVYSGGTTIFKFNKADSLTRESILAIGFEKNELEKLSKALKKGLKWQIQAKKEGLETQKNIDSFSDQAKTVKIVFFAGRKGKQADVVLQVEELINSKSINSSGNIYLDSENVKLLIAKVIDAPRQLEIEEKLLNERVKRRKEEEEKERKHREESYKRLK